MVESNGSILGTALIETADGKKSEVIPAIKEASTQLDFPTLADGDVPFKSITLINTDSSPANIEVVALDRDGSLIDHKTPPALSSMESWTFNVGDLFSSQNLDNISTIEVISDKPIIGVQLVDFPEGDVVGLPALTTTSKGWSFPITTKGGDLELWTTVGILNSVNTPASITVEAFDASEKSLGVIESVTLPSGVTYFVTTANTEGIIPIEAANLKVASDQPVSGYEVIGVVDGNGLTAVLGIPEEDQTGSGFEIVGSEDGSVLNVYPMVRNRDGVIQSAFGNIGTGYWKRINLHQGSSESKLEDEFRPADESMSAQQTASTSVTSTSTVSPFLDFPLPGANAYNALINSVFDHHVGEVYTAEMSRALEYTPGKHNVVVAYTGEEGNVNNNQDCYQQQSSKNFSLQGNYRGSLGNKTYLCYDGHPGIDYKPSTSNVNVLAAASGTVIEAGWYNDAIHYGSGGGLGRYVKIAHPQGYHTLYGHLLEGNIAVSVGQNVTGGVTVIGKTGNTGDSTGEHLHFQVRRIDASGAQFSVDPYGWEGSGVLWKIAVTSCADTLEPNNSFSGAYGPLTSGSNYSSKICSPSDIDYFKIEVSSAGTISLSHGALH